MEDTWEEVKEDEEETHGWPGRWSRSATRYALKREGGEHEYGKIRWWKGENRARAKGRGRAGAGMAHEGMGREKQEQ